MSKDTNLIIVETGGKTYLGILEEGDETKVTDALPITGGSVGSENLETWLAKKETGDLSTKTIKGASSYTTTPLSREMVSDFEVLQKYMEEARQFAEKRLIVEEFQRLCRR